MEEKKLDGAQMLDDEALADVSGGVLKAAAAAQSAEICGGAEGDESPDKLWGVCLKCWLPSFACRCKK